MKKMSSKFSTKLVFLSFYDRNYSRSSVLLNHQTNEISKEYFQIRQGRKMFQDLRKITRENIGKEIVYVVMSPSSLIILALKKFTSSRIILDCGWPLLDGFSSRSKNKFHFLEYTRIKLIDLFSMWYADLILVESEQQITNIMRNYKISRRKIKLSFTGFDESRITTAPIFDKHKLESERYVLFRGKFNEESGLQNIISAFKSNLEYINLVIITNSALKDADGVKNIKVIDKFLPEQDIFNYIANAEMCIGQLSNHPRIVRTIPHKSFESAYFGIPYVSLRTDAMIEAFPENCGVHYIDKPDASSISNAVLEIYNNQSYRKQLSKDIDKHFKKHLSQKKIAEGFLGLLYKNEIIQSNHKWNLKRSAY